MTASRDEIVSPYTPRLLSREQAAAYVGLSPEAFLKEVMAGTFPHPFPLRRTRRRLWDKAELDRILDARLKTGETGDWNERKRRWHEDRQKDAR